MSATDDLLFMSKHTSRELLTWFKSNAKSDAKLTDEKMTDQNWVHYAVM